MKQLKVTAVKHKDIKEKEQLYVVMENDEGKKIVINVGQKTFDSVNELTGTILTADQQHKEKIIPEKQKPIR